MKNIILVGFLLTSPGLLTLRAAKPDSAKNIVINGDMEAWEAVTPPTNSSPVPKFPENVWPEHFDSDVEVPDDFDASQPTGVSIAPDRLDKHGGDSSAKMENTVPRQSSALWTRELPVEPNTEYLVRVWIKGKDIAEDNDRTHGAIVWVKDGPGPGQVWWTSPTTKSEYNVPVVNQGSFPWTQYEFTFHTAEDSSLLRVSLQLRRTTGTIWFDDLEVIPMGKGKPRSNF